MINLQRQMTNDGQTIDLGIIDNSLSISAGSAGLTKW